MPCRRQFFVASLVLACVVATTRFAAAGCDPTITNDEALRDARAAIDAACPCSAATSPGTHAKCAKVVVNARVTNGQLDKTCKSTALLHAKKSICGRPGAVVCCRVKPGKTSHKIAKSAAKCTSTSTLTACTSALEFTDTGCDANGCVTPICGNDVVEPGETCEPPSGPDCSDTCQTESCEPPATSCGNGTLDVGEACEPPGTGACGWDCQATACAAPAIGEIGVACVGGSATVGIGSRGSDYLLTWTSTVHRSGADVIAQRFDVDAAALDPAARVVSDGVHCGADLFSPAVGGNADRYVLAWQSSTPEFSTVHHQSIYTRSYENDGSAGALDEPVSILTGFGMCQGFLAGPPAVAPVFAAGPHAFAALWTSGFLCVGGGGIFLRGELIDYAAPTPVTTDLTLGYPQAPPTPSHVTQTTAAIASVAGDTLLAWHVADQTSKDVAGAWLAGDGSASNFIVSSRLPGIGAGPSVTTLGLRPAVAAASDRFLVAWAQGPTTDATEIRGMRVTRAGGPLDLDGGFALPTTGGVIKAGPVAAFDGTVWLVAWIEVGVGGNDLRAVAVQTDGTVVDATPRLLASGLATASLSIASAGNGKSLVMYVKPDGGSSAIRAQLVPGT